MRRNSTVCRVLVAVLILLASLLVSTGPSSAQVTAPSSRAEQQPERSQLAELKSAGLSVAEECRMRHGQRQSPNGHASTGHHGRMCGCDARARSKSYVASPFTGRHTVPRTTRSVELPLLHQVFRC